jgi:hypothetical protein
MSVKGPKISPCYRTDILKSDVEQVRIAENAIEGDAQSNTVYFRIVPLRKTRDKRLVLSVSRE